MIKWAGFGKLLKLSFFGLLISFFTLLGGSFVKAQGKLQLIGFDSVPSYYDSNYSLNFLKGGGVLTNYLGLGKSILAINSNTFFWWTPNGLPYIYTPFGQGFPTSIFSCDQLSGDSDYPTNCSSVPLDGNYAEILKAFYSNIQSGDLAWYYYRNDAGGVNCSYSYHHLSVCWSSQSVGKTLCFGFNNGCYNGCQGGGNSCLGVIGGSLTGSQNYSGLTFSNIPYYSIGYAPGQAGYNGGGNIEGDSTNVSQSTLTGNLMSSTCDKYQALAWYNRNGYSEKLCYSSYGNNDDIFSGAGTVTAFALTGTDIKSVRSATSEYRRAGNVGGSMGYSEWLKYWRNTYEVYQRNIDIYENPFIGVPVSIFTLMGNLDVYGKPFQNDSIVDYCNLLLYSSDLSTPYSGLYSSQICSQSLIDMVGDFAGVHAQSGQVVQGSSRDGITNRPGMHNPPVGNGGSSNTTNTGTNSSDSSGTYQDGLTFENDFFNKLSSSYRFPSESNSNGIIPSYIIIFMIGIIFFRFLSH